MRVTLNTDNLQSIKTYLHRSLPDHKPSLRIEAAARGLGFTTYAGLRNALFKGDVTVSADNRRFCAELSIPFEIDERFNRYLSRAIARIELHRILDTQRLLTQRGFDSAWMRVTGEMDKPLSERLTMLEERRQEAYEDDWSFDQFELAWIYLSRQQKIKSLNRCMGSYGLKHRAENLQRHFGHFRPLGNYVSNGMLIAAAYALGFEVRSIAPDNYNAYFNISMVTVNRSRGRDVRSTDENPRLVTAMYGDLDREAA